MSIDLADFESRDDDEPDGYSKKLAKLQKRLGRAQVAHILHKRAAVLAFEGWDAAGKGGIIRRATAEMDPRHFETWPIGAPTDEEKARHFLWRFWRALPAKGDIAVFDRTWYGRVLVERVEALCTKAEWQRAFDEINAFESTLVEDGVTLIKVFVHVTQEEQDRRLVERLEDPWKRWKTGAEDYRNRARRKDYLAAMHDMFARTDTRWAPWTVIDGNNEKAARLVALEKIAEGLEARVSMTPPPLDTELVDIAEEALGRTLDV